MFYLNTIVIYLLVIEILLILFFIILIPIHRILLFYRKTADDRKKEELSQTIISSLEGKELPPLYLSKFRDLKNLLLTLETFEYRIRGKEWEALKDKIVKAYLLPIARKKANSFSWVKRNFAARCFALCSLQKDEKIQLKLINDPIFLVRSIAALALVRLEHKQGILEVIKQMSREKGYAHFFYRDLLLKCSKKQFEWIQEIAEQEKDPLIHLTCLELLTERGIVKIPNYLREDAHSDHVNIRLQAVKILARNPQEDSRAILIKSTEDPIPEIREEAVSGLQYFASNEVFSKLTEALRDSVWLVRLKAAQTLKKMGQKGIEILKDQNQNTNKNAYEVSQAVLEHNW
jgi:hypothetical protein